jgi:DNA processing protein
MNHALEKIALSMLDGIGPITSRQLIAYLGSPEAVFMATKKELQIIPGVGDKTVHTILHAKEVLVRAEAELLFIEKNKIRLLFYTDKNYPYRLKAQEDSPIVLYIKGPADLDHHRIVAIIGTRSPTDLGRSITEKIISDLEPYEPMILSGLAYGIDITAHKKSLDVDLATVAVLGHGLDKIYPTDHRTIANKIASQGGLISQFPTQTIPDRENFPMRNKVVAGLADAVLVVESKIEGGSMITAEYANLYHKDVFAIPGRSIDEWSSGCNVLIKRNKANLVESAADIAHFMNWDKKSHKAVQPRLFHDLSETEQSVVELMRQHEYISIDRIYQEIQKTPGSTAGLLLDLEFKGLIKSLPGKKYMLVR